MLGIKTGKFAELCQDPLAMLRFRHYPPPTPGTAAKHGTKPHSDRSMLTVIHELGRCGMEHGYEVGGKWAQTQDRLFELPTGTGRR